MVDPSAVRQVTGSRSPFVCRPRERSANDGRRPYELDSSLTSNVKRGRSNHTGVAFFERRLERRQALNPDASLILAPDGFNVSLAIDVSDPSWLQCGQKLDQRGE